MDYISTTLAPELTGLSVIIPAYNEERFILPLLQRVKQSLNQLDIANEIIVVNDGSTDGTSDVVNSMIKGDARFRFIDRKENRGKAVSLNEALQHISGEFVATMDADSAVDSDIIGKVLPYFEDPKMGAVTVTVEVRKPKTWLQKIISIEYIIGLSLFLKIYSLFNGIFVRFISVRNGQHLLHFRRGLLEKRLDLWHR